MSQAHTPPCGVVIIDKPAGMTSHDVIDRVRAVMMTRRVGHAGTLDPAASGVLVVAFGPATRFLEYVVADAKAYDATVRLGVRTDTLDLDGAVLERRDASGVREADVREALRPLTGTFLQTPPMYSAVKVDGQPLHKAARRGEEILREPRPVTVRRLELMKFAPPDAHIEVECGKGTYVRCLAEAIGEHLGCGACLAALRRTRSGRFTLADAVALDDLTAAHARGMAFFLGHLPEARLDGAEAEKFRHGQTCDAAHPGDGLVRVHGEDGGFLGVAQRLGARLKPRKVMGGP